MMSAHWFFAVFVLWFLDSLDLWLDQSFFCWSFDLVADYLCGRIVVDPVAFYMSEGFLRADLVFSNFNFVVSLLLNPVWLFRFVESFPFFKILYNFL